MLLTTSHHFEDYIIDSYCGIVSGECVLGTGFLSTLDASIADFLGISSSSYNEKLDSAKQAALSILEEKASALGANAIIAIDIDYTSFTSDLIGVIANGTAVKVTSTGSLRDFPLSAQDSCIMQPLRLILKSDAHSVFGKVEVSPSFPIQSLSCILADIELTTFFGSSLSLTDIVFSDFSKSIQSLVSCYCPLPLSTSQLHQIQSASMSIVKYSSNNSPAVALPSASPVSVSNPVPSQNLLASVESLHSAREILAFLQEWKKAPSNNIPIELETQIENLAKAERLYGNMKDSCIQKLIEYGFKA